MTPKTRLTYIFICNMITKKKKRILVKYVFIYWKFSARRTATFGLPLLSDTWCLICTMNGIPLNTALPQELNPFYGALSPTPDLPPLNWMILFFNLLGFARLVAAAQAEQGCPERVLASKHIKHFYYKRTHDIIDVDLFACWPVGLGKFLNGLLD